MKSDEVYIDFKDVKKAYQICCEEYALTKTGLAQLQGVLTDLSKTGLVNLKNIDGRFLVSLPEIPITILRKELEKITNNERNKQDQSKK